MNPADAIARLTTGGYLPGSTYTATATYWSATATITNA
jgi:hypothetical protein